MLTNDIPEQLRLLHREKKVVFFCEAGISYQLGLGDYQCLVKDLFEKANMEEELSQDFKEEFENNSYDKCLQYLEEELGKKRFRKQLKEWAEIKIKKYSTHKALINLSTIKQDSEEKTRLVTTNFDRGFVDALKDENKDIDIDFAPKLSVPKPYKWNSIVHLHGLIDKNSPENIVVASGDFGIAYITERWASRFVANLFQSYTIVFVGYSLNDPVMRYLTDAIKVDRKYGENQNKIYAFTSKEKEQKKWELTGIETIKYSSKNEHAELHEILAEWDKAYTSGLGNFKKVAFDLIQNPPSLDFKTNYFIDNFFVEREKIISFLVVILDSLKQNEPPSKSCSDPNPSEKNLNCFIEWWLYLSKIDNDKLMNCKTKKNQPYKEVINALVKPRESQFVVTLEDYHRCFFGWFLSLLNENDLQKWVVDKGAILHPDFHYLVRLEYPQKRETLSKDKKKFWDFILYKRDYLIKNYINKDNLFLSDNIFYLPKIDNLAAKLEYIKKNLKPYVSISFNDYVKEKFTKKYFLQKIDNENQLPSVINKIKDKSQLIGLFETFNSYLLEVINTEKDFGVNPYIAEKNFYYDIKKNIYWGFTSGFDPIDYREEDRGNWTYLMSILAMVADKTEQLNPKLLKQLSTRWFGYPIIFFKRMLLHVFKFKKVYTEEEVVSEMTADSNVGSYFCSDCTNLEWVKLMEKRWESFTSKSKEKIFDVMLKKTESSNKNNNFENFIWVKFNWLKDHGWLTHRKAKEWHKEINKKKGGRFFKNLKMFQSNNEEAMLLDISTNESVSLNLFEDNKKRTTEIIDELKKLLLDYQKKQIATAIKVRLCFLDVLSCENEIIRNNFFKFFKEIIKKKDSFCKELQKNIFIDLNPHNLKKLKSDKIVEIILEILYSLDESLLKENANPIIRIIQYFNQKKYFLLQKEKDFKFWKKFFKITLKLKPNVSEIPIYNPLKANELYLIVLTSLFIENPKRDTEFPSFFKDAWEMQHELSEERRKNILVCYGVNLYGLFWVNADWTKKNIIPLMKWGQPLATILWKSYFSYPKWSDELVIVLKEDLLQTKKYIKDSSENDDLMIIRKYLIFLTNVSIRKLIKPGEYRTAIQENQLTNTEINQILTYLFNSFQMIAEDKRDNFWKNYRKSWTKNYWFREKKYLQVGAIHWTNIIFHIPNPTPEDFELIFDLIVPEKNINIIEYHFFHHYKDSNNKVSKLLETKIKKYHHEERNHNPYLQILEKLTPKKTAFEMGISFKDFENLLDKLKDIKNISDNEDYKSLREKIEY